MTFRRPAAHAGYLLASGLLALSLVASCSRPDAATGDQAPRTRTRIPAPSLTGAAACFYPRQVQDFRVLDRSNLIVYAPNDRHAYHVQISPPSTDLRYADSLAFLPSNDRICGYAGERLIIGRSTDGPRAAVIAVSRLSPESLESLRAGHDGAGSPAVAPRPGPGAAIEGESGRAPVAPPAGKADSTVDK